MHVQQERREEKSYRNGPNGYGSELGVIPKSCAFTSGTRNLARSTRPSNGIGARKPEADAREIPPSAELRRRRDDANLEVSTSQRSLTSALRPGPESVR